MKEMTIAMQNYLEIIYEYTLNNEKARVSDIAKKLNVSKPSVNNAVNILALNGYVIAQRYADIKITKSGMQYAKAISNKHQTIQQLFVEVIGISEEVANKDACKIEHVISNESLLAIQKYLSTYHK